MDYLDFKDTEYTHESDLSNLRALLVKLDPRCPDRLPPVEAGSIGMDQFQEWCKDTATSAATSAAQDYVDTNRESLRGEQGPQGSTGVGISNIRYYYAATPESTPPTLDEVSSPTIPLMTSYRKYLWKKEVTTFTDNSTSSVISLAGVYGDTGNTGEKGDDGSSYTVTVESSNGSTFRKDAVSTTLSCHVYLNGQEITDSLDASRFMWKRNSGNAAQDASWANITKAMCRKSVEITPEDCQGRTVFFCEVDLPQ